MIYRKKNGKTCREVWRGRGALRWWWWERTSRTANDPPIHFKMRKNAQKSQGSTYLFYLIGKIEKDGPSRQASSTLAGCGRPEPENFQTLDYLSAKTELWSKSNFALACISSFSKRPLTTRTKSSSSACSFILRQTLSDSVLIFRSFKTH